MADIGRAERSSRRTGLFALHALLGVFPLAYFLLAFATDVVYARSANLQWQYFSIWLIVAGLVTGGASILAGALDWLVRSRDVGGRGTGWHMLVAILAWLLALLNSLIHSRDGWTAVVPEGLILSGIVALLMIIATTLAAWTGRNTR